MTMTFATQKALQVRCRPLGEGDRRTGWGMGLRYPQSETQCLTPVFCEAMVVISLWSSQRIRVEARGLPTVEYDNNQFAVSWEDLSTGKKGEFRRGSYIVTPTQGLNY